MEIIKYRDRIVDVLRDDVYSELMNFWKKVEESRYDYKIFVSKKCYVLYRAFLPLLHFHAYEDCVKITDAAIPFYLKKMKGKKVLIVDDVFIHGRTSLKIREEISPYAKKIDFYVFAKNNNQNQTQDISAKKINDLINEYIKNKEESKEYIDENIFDSLFSITAKNKKEKNKENNLIKQNECVQGHIKCVKDYQWKRISDLIMKCLWSINMPYVSYLPTFSLHDNKKIHALRFIQLNSHRQEKLHQHFSYYVSSSENRKAIIHYCFIFARNSFMNDCKVTPMVFFDCENTSINKGFINDGLSIIYGDMADELKGIFQQCKKNGNGLISMLKYLIFSVGYLATIRLFSERGIQETEYDIDATNAIFSFGIQIKKYLNRLKKMSTDNTILNKIEKSTIRNFKRNNGMINEGYRIKLLRGLEDAYESMQSCKMEKDCLPIVDTLSKYFKFNNMFDEEHIYKVKQENYVRGLKFSDIKEVLQEKGFDVCQIIAGLMYQYNLGAATIDFLYDFDDKENIVGINMYWRSGEQSYKCISNTYVLPVYFQNLYNRFFDRKIAEFLYDIFIEILERNYHVWEIPFCKSDFEKYCGIKDDVYDAFDIEEYCEQEEFKYLGYLGKEMEQFIFLGHIQEAYNNDRLNFKKNLFEFTKKRADKKIIDNCEKLLWGERDIVVY